MCGIVAYVGRSPAAPILIEGLSRLEYRGYDSAGLAVLGRTGTTCVRTVGRVRALEAALPKRLTGTVGIAHTRWATHGPATEPNAHPHRSADGRVSVVHNGIIDNAAALRAALSADGVELASDTDTEVLAHLVARAGADTLEDAVRLALGQVNGTYAIAVLDETHPDRVVVARNGSPLLIGVGDKEMYVASDVAALVRHTSSIVTLGDGEFATVTREGFRTFDARAVEVTRTPERITLTEAQVSLGGHETFMHKEMHEQPEAVEAVLRGRLDERFATARLDGLNLSPRQLRAFSRVKILGCGSAYYIGQFGAQLIEDVVRIPADAEPASEFRYRNPIIEPDTLYVVVSQSGETADTAFAVAEVQRKGGTVIGLVNVVGSSIARAVDGGIYLHAGPEVAVASTKALTAMGVAFGLLALLLGRLHDLSYADGARLLRALQALPGQVREVLAQEESLAEAGQALATATSAFFVGRVWGYPVAREGAQKLKEISYVHAEAYPTSELKHGPLALIESGLPTVAIVPGDGLIDRNLAACAQVRARGGSLVVVTQEGADLGELATPVGGPDVRVVRVPRSEPELDPILLTIPLQLLAYHAARARGLDIDKPRNLAKSVTVE